MFLHLQVPGFHAVVHQARLPSLRGRPVAVAVDAGLRSPLISTSPQARTRHIVAGMRTDEALRRCPELQVVMPDPEAYRAMQRRLTALCARSTSRVGGSAGRLDLDLSQTWQRRMGDCVPADPHSGAMLVATDLRGRCARELHLDVYVGGGPRLLIARLAATLARGSQVGYDGIAILGAAEEAAATDLMPIVLLTDCDAHIRELLEHCGITTIGQLRALSADDLLGLVGPGGAQVYDVLHGLREEVVPEIRDPEPSLASTCRADDDGAGAEGVDGMIHVMARGVASQLRSHHLGCTRLTLEITWRDARTATASVDLRYQVTADHALAAAAHQLYLAHPRHDARVERLNLMVSGLCTAELQEEWFRGGCPAAAETTAVYDPHEVKSVRPARGSTARRQRQ